MRYVGTTLGSKARFDADSIVESKESTLRGGCSWLASDFIQSSWLASVMVGLLYTLMYVLRHRLGLPVCTGRVNDANKTAMHVAVSQRTYRSCWLLMPVPVRRYVGMFCVASQPAIADRDSGCHERSIGSDAGQTDDE